MYEPTTTTDQRLPKGLDRLTSRRSSTPLPLSAHPGRICAACHLEMPVRRRASEQRAAFAIGAILATVPLLFLLTSPGASQPGLWTRLAICAGGGVAGVLLWRVRHPTGSCPACR
jgi:hypothetical protein